MAPTSHVVSNLRGWTKPAYLERRRDFAEVTVPAAGCIHSRCGGRGGGGFALRRVLLRHTISNQRLPQLKKTREAGLGAKSNSNFARDGNCSTNKRRGGKKETHLALGRCRRHQHGFVKGERRGEHRLVVHNRVHRQGPQKAMAGRRV